MLLWFRTLAHAPDDEDDGRNEVLALVSFKMLLFVILFCGFELFSELAVIVVDWFEFSGLQEIQDKLLAKLI